MNDLNDKILAAHAEEDQKALIGLYAQAADNAPDVDTKCFFLTHAYVFALEASDLRVPELRMRLAAHGREPAD